VVRSGEGSTRHIALLQPSVVVSAIYHMQVDIPGMAKGRYKGNIPNLGDIISDKQPGQKPHRLIWTRCPDCGVERWQQYRPSKPGSTRRCKECHTNHTRRLFKIHRSYYSERFIGDTGVTFPSYEANSDGNKVSPIKRSH
jgi:hypothetical protein